MPKAIPDFGTYTGEDFARLIVAAITDSGPEVRELVAEALDEDTLGEWSDEFARAYERRVG